MQGRARIKLGENDLADAVKRAENLKGTGAIRVLDYSKARQLSNRVGLPTDKAIVYLARNGHQGNYLAIFVRGNVEKAVKSATLIEVIGKLEGIDKIAHDLSQGDYVLQKRRKEAKAIPNVIKEAQESLDKLDLRYDGYRAAFMDILGYTNRISDTQHLMRRTHSRIQEVVDELNSELRHGTRRGKPCKIRAYSLPREDVISTLDEVFDMPLEGQNLKEYNSLLSEGFAVDPKLKEETKGVVDSLATKTYREAVKDVLRYVQNCLGKIEKPGSNWEDKITSLVDVYMQAIEVEEPSIVGPEYVKNLLEGTLLLLTHLDNADKLIPDQDCRKDYVSAIKNQLEVIQNIPTDIMLNIVYENDSYS